MEMINRIVARCKRSADEVYDLELVTDAIDEHATWHGTDVNPAISLTEYILWINDPKWKVLIKPWGEDKYFLIPCDEDDLVDGITDALDSQGEEIASYVGQDIEELREQVKEKDPHDLVFLADSVNDYGGWFFGQEHPMPEQELLSIIVKQLNLPKKDVLVGGNDG